MSNYDNTNKIVIFNNENAKDSQPHYKGTVNVNGKDYDVSLWVKESQQGKKYFSGSIQEPRQKDSVSSQPDNKPKVSNDDDLPF